MSWQLTCCGHVEAMGLLAELGQLINGLLVNLGLLEVGGDTAGGDALGDDTVAANLAPGEDELSGGDAETVGDLLDLVGVDEQRHANVVVAKGRVGSQVNALLGAVLDELGLGETGVALDLVDGGGDAGLLDENVDLWELSVLLAHTKLIQEPYHGGGAVGNTNGADLGLGQVEDSCRIHVSTMQYANSLGITTHPSMWRPGRHPRRSRPRHRCQPSWGTARYRWGKRRASG